MNEMSVSRITVFFRNPIKGVLFSALYDSIGFCKRFYNHCILLDIFCNKNTIAEMSKRESLLLLVQDNDGSYVASKAKEALRRNGIAFDRAFSGQKSEFSCVLYVDEIVVDQRARALQVLQDAFIVLEENFEDERGEETTEERMRRQQEGAARAQPKSRFSRMLWEHRSSFLSDPLSGGDAPFMNN